MLFRCSALSEIMTEPKTKSEGSLSVGAKTYLKKVAREQVYGFREEISSKYMDKGIQVEGESIALYNRVHFTDLQKNTERRNNEWITGEPDLIAPDRGIDIKSAWSLATFPVLPEDCHSKGYEWQARGYMMLWELPKWEIAYCMVSTPDELLRYEQPELHIVDHIPEHLRVTSVIYERDLALEDKIKEKAAVAQDYLLNVIEMIKQTHGA